MLDFITNHYDVAMPRPKLKTDVQYVFRPNDEWNYAHHPFIVRFKSEYILSCSSGHNNEDDVGQRMVCMRSRDLTTWSELTVVAEPGHPATGVVIPSGMYVSGDTLVAYYLQFDYLPEVLKDGHRKMGNGGRVNWGFWYKTSTDAIHWSQPARMQCFGGNMPVQKLASGRLFSCGGTTHAWSDCPDGMNGWQSVTVCPPGYGNKPGDVRSDDDMCGLVSDTHVSLCEGSFIQQDSGRIWVMMRSATPWLWANCSDDNGETWTLPQQTRFTDNRTKFFLGRLPDKRYYYVGTPDPFPPRTRHVLALSLSDDGLDYKTHYLLADAQYKGRYPAIDKNGVYGYPCCLIDGGSMLVAYSLNKEVIALMKLDLAQL